MRVARSGTFALMALGLVVLPFVVAACVSDDPMTGVYVSNYTPTTITVAYVRDGSTVSLSRPIETGGTATFGSYQGGECSPAPLLALDPSGRIVAQRDAPLCPSESWIIGTRPSGSP